MAMVIGTNVASVNAQRHLASSRTDMEQAMERLSSGHRINSASDDAAGLSISGRMEAQITGLNQAVRNSNDGIGMVQSVEGAMDEITNILQRMRELAVQSANDVNTSADRNSLQAEVVQLQSELSRISAQTSYNGQKVLDGTYSSKSLQVGYNDGDTISVTIASTATTELGSYNLVSDSISPLISGEDGVVKANAVTDAGADLVVTGSKGTDTLALGAAATAKETAAAVNLQTSATGVSATAKTQIKLAGFDAASYTLTINDIAITSSTITATNITTLADNINAQAASTGVTATMSADKASMILTDLDGDDIKLEGISTGTVDAEISAYDVNIDGTVSDTAVTVGTSDIDGAVDVTDSLRVVGSIKFTSTAAFTVANSATATGTQYVSGTDSGSLNAISTVDIGTVAGSSTALGTIDGALEKIAAERSELGAIQNRMEHTISNLMNVAENTSAARSRIVDADFAGESAALAKAQVLQQAGTAMLAQANASTQNVLSLLK